MKVRANTWDSRIVNDVLIRNEYGLPPDMRGMVVVDIGAHIGAFTVACQKRNAKKIYCYEADPENAQYLMQNVQEDVESRTEIHIYAVPVTGASRDNLGIRRLSDHDGPHGKNTGHVDIFGEPDGTKSIGFNEVVGSIAENIDLLKLDCEGAEWEIFEFGDFSKVQAIVAELHEVQPDGALPSLIRGVEFTELCERAVHRLKRFNFNVSVIHLGAGLAKLTAMRTATVNLSERKPKLLWIGDAVRTTGYARVTEQICRRLVNKGWDVRVLGIGYNGDPHNYPYKIYPGVDANTGGHPNGISRLPDIMRRFKPDVVVVQDDSWNVGIVVDNMAVMNFVTPTVGYVAVDSENVREDVALQLRNLKHVICHTQFGIEQLQKAGYSGRSSIAGHGVDENLYAPYDKKQAREGLPTLKTPIDEAFIWGAVGVNQPRKRLDLTIAYWAAWWKYAGSPENAYLYMHTNADGVWDLRQLIQFHGIRGHVISTEGGQALTEQQMPAMYSALDAMISTAEGESWGLTHLEGMACGVPQIAVNCGGMPYWAGDGIYWVDPAYYQFTANRTNTLRRIAREQDFIAAMQDMYTNPELRDHFARHGREVALRYKWDDVAAHFDKVLHQVLNTQKIATQSSSDALSDFE